MKNSIVKLVILSLVAGLGFSSCSKTTSQELRDLEKEMRDKYIAKYHSDVEPKPSGLYFIETKAPAADADSIKAGDVVQVFYEGYLIEEDATLGMQDGLQFDSSGDYEPFEFQVGSGSVITGWDEAMSYMKEGSEAKLVIPSTLGYGGQYQGAIPRYSTLIFYIRVDKVIHSDDDPVVIEKIFGEPRL